MDIVLQAETGLMSVTGDAGQEPTKAGVPIIDAASGAMLTVETITLIAPVAHFFRAMPVFNLCIDWLSEQVLEQMALSASISSSVAALLLLLLAYRLLAYIALSRRLRSPLKR